MITLEEFRNVMKDVDAAPEIEMDTPLQCHLESAIEEFIEKKLKMEPTHERKVAIGGLIVIMMEAGSKLDLDPIGKPVGMVC